MCLIIARDVYQDYTVRKHCLLDACLIAFSLAEWCLFLAVIIPLFDGELMPVIHQAYARCLDRSLSLCV
jgi:hypothetical protein